MRFRIRTWMILTVSASIVPATWHLIPAGRWTLIFSFACAALVSPPLRTFRTHAGPWSRAQRAGFVGLVVAAAVGTVSLMAMPIINPDLTASLAKWPG